MSDSAAYTDTKSPNPPTWFWIISGIGLVWNLAGVVAFIGQITMDMSGLAETIMTRIRSCLKFNAIQ